MALRTIRSWKRRRWVSLAMIGLGVLLLSSTAGYYVYAAVARSQLADLEYTVSPENLDSPAEASTGAVTTPPEGVSPAAAVTGSDSGALPSSSFISLYPGKLLPSLYWDDPRRTDVEYDSYTSLFEGFTPLDDSAALEVAGDLPAPTRIEIPAISLDSTVNALSIINLGDARAWETPKNVVGHIPTTANPGEEGNSYLFGHLQSPIRGEGSVFRNLPEIPDLLRQGEKVYIVMSNEERTEFLYQVTQTGVVKATDFTLEHSAGATVTLVSCVPKYVYDHRLLVTAELVGVKR